MMKSKMETAESVPKLQADLSIYCSHMAQVPFSPAIAQLLSYLGLVHDTSTPFLVSL